MFTSFFRWLTRPVIEHCDFDRPFRLRGVSLLLLAGGWGLFFVSCLAAIIIIRAGVPVHGWADLTGGRLTPASLPVLQWVRFVGEAAGAILFFAGLASVAIFDRQDGICVWTPGRS